MLRKLWFRGFVISVWFVTIWTAGCDQVAPDPKSVVDPALEAQAPGERTPTVVDVEPDGTTTFVVDYAPAISDVVVLLDRSANEDIRSRMNYAANAFAARAGFTAVDYRLQVMTQDDQGAPRWRPGGPIRRSAEARRQTFERLAYEGSPEVPLDLSAAMQEIDSMEIRSDSTLAVLLISESVPSADAMREIVNALNATAERWSFSALVPSGGNSFCGSSFADDRTLEEVTSDSGGILGSICDDSFASFFSRYLVEGTGADVFHVEIDPGLNPEHLTITRGGDVLNDWTYDAILGRLALSRMIPLGSEITITVRPPEPDPEPEPEPEPVDPPEEPEDPEPPPTPVDPGEAVFLADINPILENNCSGAGCHGEGTANREYVGQYQEVRAGKDAILDRVQRDENTPGRMPPSGMDPEELQALIDYLNGL